MSRCVPPPEHYEAPHHWLRDEVSGEIWPALWEPVFGKGGMWSLANFNADEDTPERLWISGWRWYAVARPPQFDPVAELPIDSVTVSFEGA